MPIMRDIVTDVLDELRFGSGQGVQIHLETGIVKNISRVYRTLMLEYVWRDYHFINSYAVDSTGNIIGGIIPDTLDKFSNIIAVYLENSNEPLPVAPVSMNPSRFRRPVLIPRGGTNIFGILPAQERNITVISRMYKEDDFGMDEDIPFYRDVLALGAALMLSVKAGTNDPLTKSLEQQFSKLISIYRVNELQDVYQTYTNRGSYPMEWFEK